LITKGGKQKLPKTSKIAEIWTIQSKAFDFEEHFLNDGTISLSIQPFSGEDICPKGKTKLPWVVIIGQKDIWRHRSDDVIYIWRAVNRRDVLSGTSTVKTLRQWE
jgi:hypothetical protein